MADTCTSNSDGFYLGGGASVNGDAVNHVVRNDGGADSMYDVSGQTTLGYGFHLMGGYTFSIDTKQLIDFELNANLDSYHLRKIWHDGNYSAADSRSFILGMKKIWGTSLIARYGYYFAERTAATVGLGLDLCQWEINSRNVANLQTISSDQQNMTVKRVRLGASPRIGIIHNLSNDKFVRAECAFHLNSFIKIHQEVTPAVGSSFEGLGPITMHKLQPVQYKLTFTYGIRF